MLNRIRMWARKLKKKVFVLFFAYKDERVPWYSKLFAACIVAYAFSPIDLIPDFIPILGYIDDIIIVPLGIKVALKIIPDIVIHECEGKAEELMKKGKPKNWFVGSMVIVLWVVIIVFMAIKFYNYLAE